MSNLFVMERLHLEALEAFESRLLVLCSREDQADVHIHLSIVCTENKSARFNVK